MVELHLTHADSLNHRVKEARTGGSVVSGELATSKELSAGGHGGPPCWDLENAASRRVGHRADQEEAMGFSTFEG
jgi:hypothetical protein